MAKSQLLFLFCITFCLSFQSLAQRNKYFIAFADKNNSSYSLENPQEYLSQRAIDRRLKQNILISSRDLPVNTTYIQAVQETGARVLYTSKWMNAALIEADQAVLEEVKQLSFVQPAIELASKNVNSRRTARKSTKQYFDENRALKNIVTNGFADEPLDYGYSLNQITMAGADRMHEMGFTGKGILMAIFDSGFRNANLVPSLFHLFNENRILATYDFVNYETSVFEDDSHGLQVLSTIAAFKPGELIGTAYTADFILLRTEDAGSESRIEEINWLFAAEYADSAGVDIISSSLGYNQFDHAAMNYRPSDMDGNTALITKAADLAASTGMLVVNSAGNEGNDAWQTISAPADADSVLTVGAVDKNQNYALFSSRGPSADGRVKPDLSLQGLGTVVSLPSGNTATSNGTSFSAPLMAGLAAGFWQAYPHLTNMQVIDYLKRSASQYSKPDSLIGFGIPNFSKAAKLAELDKDRLQEMCIVYPNPLEENTLTLWVNPVYTNEKLMIQYFDVSGKMISNQDLIVANTNNNLFLDPFVFKTGMYILKVTSSSISYTTKFVKK